MKKRFIGFSLAFFFFLNQASAERESIIKAKAQQEILFSFL